MPEIRIQDTRVRGPGGAGGGPGSSPGVDEDAAARGVSNIASAVQGVLGALAGNLERRAADAKHADLQYRQAQLDQVDQLALARAGDIDSQEFATEEGRARAEAEFQEAIRTGYEKAIQGADSDVRTVIGRQAQVRTVKATTAFKTLAIAKTTLGTRQLQVDTAQQDLDRVVDSGNFSLLEGWIQRSDATLSSLPSTARRETVQAASQAAFETMLSNLQEANPQQAERYRAIVLGLPVAEFSYQDQPPSTAQAAINSFADSYEAEALKSPSRAEKMLGLEFAQSLRDASDVLDAFRPADSPALREPRPLGRPKEEAAFKELFDKLPVAHQVELTNSARDQVNQSLMDSYQRIAIAAEDPGVSFQEYQALVAAEVLQGGGAQIEGASQGSKRNYLQQLRVVTEQKAKAAQELAQYQYLSNGQVPPPQRGTVDREAWDNGQDARYGREFVEKVKFEPGQRLYGTAIQRAKEAIAENRNEAPRFLQRFLSSVDLTSAAGVAHFQKVYQVYRDIQDGTPTTIDDLDLPDHVETMFRALDAEGAEGLNSQAFVQAVEGINESREHRDVLSAQFDEEVEKNSLVEQLGYEDGWFTDNPADGLLVARMESAVTAIYMRNGGKMEAAIAQAKSSLRVDAWNDRVIADAPTAVYRDISLEEQQQDVDNVLTRIHRARDPRGLEDSRKLTHADVTPVPRTVNGVTRYHLWDEESERFVPDADGLPAIWTPERTFSETAAEALRLQARVVAELELSRRTDQALANSRMRQETENFAKAIGYEGLDAMRATVRSEWVRLTEEDQAAWASEASDAEERLRLYVEDRLPDLDPEKQAKRIGGPRRSGRGPSGGK